MELNPVVTRPTCFLALRVLSSGLIDPLDQVAISQSDHFAFWFNKARRRNYELNVLSPKEAAFSQTE